jgi:hypothetical protein
MAELMLADLVKFDVSLEEIISVCRLILQNTKDQKVRGAIRTMFEELNKANTSLVDSVLVPLQVSTQKDFDKQFPVIRSNFKKLHLGGQGFLSQIQCGVVTSQLHALIASKQWRKRIPLLNRAVARLELVADRWIADDSVLYQADQRMWDDINKFMKAVAAKTATNPKQGFAEFREGVEGVEDTFLQLRKHLAELQVLSNSL